MPLFALLFLWKTRVDVFKNKRNLKGKNVSISESLTSRKLDLLKKLKLNMEEVKFGHTEAILRPLLAIYMWLSTLLMTSKFPYLSNLPCFIHSVFYLMRYFFLYNVYRLALIFDDLAFGHFCTFFCPVIKSSVIFWQSYSYGCGLYDVRPCVFFKALPVSKLLLWE